MNQMKIHDLHCRAVAMETFDFTFSPLAPFLSLLAFMATIALPVIFNLLSATSLAKEWQEGT